MLRAYLHTQLLTYAINHMGIKGEKHHMNKWANVDVSQRKFGKQINIYYLFTINYCN